jgi:hypothetical protein
MKYEVGKWYKNKKGEIDLVISKEKCFISQRGFRILFNKCNKCDGWIRLLSQKTKLCPSLINLEEA